jgi:hypothetical protein
VCLMDFLLKRPYSSNCLSVADCVSTSFSSSFMCSICLSVIVVRIVGQALLPVPVDVQSGR